MQANQIQTTHIFVTSAPSGTGKTTLNHQLVKNFPQVSIAVSHTTRKRRPNEREGIDYHFVTNEQFDQLIADGQMIEYAKVFDHYYGTSKSEVERLVKLQKTVILEIDVQGWQQTKKIFPEARSIFIAPPTMETVWKRLESRGTDDLRSRYKRLMTAYSEIGKCEAYDYFVVNDQFETAYQQLVDLIIYGRNEGLSREKGLAHCRALLSEFDQATWLAELKKQLQAG